MRYIKLFENVSNIKDCLDGLCIDAFVRQAADKFKINKKYLNDLLENNNIQGFVDLLTTNIDFLKFTSRLIFFTNKIINMDLKDIYQLLCDNSNYEFFDILKRKNPDFFDVLKKYDKDDSMDMAAELGSAGF